MRQVGTMMQRRHRTLCTFAGLGLLITAYAAMAGAYPQVIQQILDRGLTLVSPFEPVPGIRAYLLEAQGKPVTVYVLQDGKHAIVGTLIDEAGNDLSTPVVDELFVERNNRIIWSRLESSHWIGDGNPAATKVIYAFVDPNCPYCHRFREAAEPWVQSDQVQIRHILVGVLAASSLPKAATIMGSENPQAAYTRNFERFDQGGIEPVEAAQTRGEPRVAANNQLMRQLGVQATPGIYYLDSSGEPRLTLGLPDNSALSRMMAQ